MATPRVFISHASADAEFANRLSDDLRDLGADVWLDSSHMGAGDFVAHINAALAGRDTVILVMTPTAIQSPWVNREVNTAITRETQGLMHPMIVVMAQPCDPNAVPPLWTTYHRYDATIDYPSALEGVAKQLGLATPEDADLDGVVSAGMGPVAAPFGGYPPAPVWQKAIAATAVEPSWLSAAVTVTLTIATLIIWFWANITGESAQATSALVTALMSQTAGFGILWATGGQARKREGRATRHSWLTGGSLAAEALMALALYLLSIQDTYPPAQVLANSFIFMAVGLFAVILVTEIVMTAMTRQWSWLFYLLIPPLAIPLSALATEGVGESISRLGVALAYGTLITWLFIMLAFALVGPARRAR